MSISTWDEIRTAYHVARMGTVSGAADALGVHHATVIRHIDALEQRLGVKLFQRHARGYTSTEAGQDLLQVAQATDDQFTQLVGRIRGRGDGVTGELTFAEVIRDGDEHGGTTVSGLVGPVDQLDGHVRDLSESQYRVVGPGARNSVPGLEWSLLGQCPTRRLDAASLYLARCSVRVDDPPDVGHGPDPRDAHFVFGVRRGIAGDASLFEGLQEEVLSQAKANSISCSLHQLSRCRRIRIVTTLIVFAK